MKLFLTASTLIVSLFNIRNSVGDDSIGLCCLCSGCGRIAAGRSQLLVDRFGKTCNTLYLEMADPSNSSKQGNPKCRQLVSKFRPRCCDPSHVPAEIAAAPTASPGSHIEAGNEPLCHLCHDATFPSNPFTTIRVLDRFINGTNTCQDLYFMGRRGRIPEQICKPLQNFCDKPCGCSLAENLLDNDPVVDEVPEPTAGVQPPPSLRATSTPVARSIVPPPPTADPPIRPPTQVTENKPPTSLRLPTLPPRVQSGLKPPSPSTMGSPVVPPKKNSKSGGEKDAAKLVTKVRGAPSEPKNSKSKRGGLQRSRRGA